LAGHAPFAPRTETGPPQWLNNQMICDSIINTQYQIEATTDRLWVRLFLQSDRLHNMTEC